MHPLPGQRTAVGVVGSQQDVVHLPQGAIGRQRLKFKHVQCCPTDLAALQGADEGSFFYNGATGGVD